MRSFLVKVDADGYEWFYFEAESSGNAACMEAAAHLEDVPEEDRPALDPLCLVVREVTQLGTPEQFKIEYTTKTEYEVVGVSKS